MSETAVMSFACELARNTGSYGSPVWAACNSVQDCTLNLEVNEADASSRGGGGFVITEAALTKLSVDGKFLGKKSTNDLPADIEAIRAAFFGKTALEFLALDGPAGTAHSQGIRATMKVFKFTRNEGLNDHVTYDFTLKPCIADNAPAWYEDAGS